MRLRPVKILCLFLLLGLTIPSYFQTRVANAQNPPKIGERPALEAHINQTDIESGVYKFNDLLDIGEGIFATRWNILDGQGRPAATGDNAPTKRNPLNFVPFIRTSAPDSTSCADCHHQPTIGGAGGFVSNVFVLAQNLDPVTDSVSADFSDERNTLGMNGSGAIEMLAREMTVDLLALRQLAINNAQQAGSDQTVSLNTKGVNFGQLTAHPDGSVDASMVQGVDPDLVIKPFGQKGVVNSVRVFTVNAYNHHHGMEAVERFGVGQIDSAGNIITTNDFDQDGVPDELTVGDITAATIFQVAMNIPGRVTPTDSGRLAAAVQGESLFQTIGCATCHLPTLSLQSASFSEPNPFNPPGNLRPQDVGLPFSFDMTKDIPSPQLEKQSGGGAVVRAYTDLKRHVICDGSDPFFCNERLIQNGVPTNQFITRKLWDVGSSAPYGHRGDLTTITEAILHHAGEARPQRDSFAALPIAQQNAIVEFLKQLQALPNGAPPQITDQDLKSLLRAQSKVGSTS
ncbi:MAG: hypothetical protein J2P21_05140 [Chloracidobacterium sp.]|nr:hypothetical protein [Chloracidobacterium sp.]